MVETRARRGKRKKENPRARRKGKLCEEGKVLSEKIVKVKFVRDDDEDGSEKASDVSRRRLKATNSYGMRKSDHIEAGPAARDDGEEKSGSSMKTTKWTTDKRSQMHPMKTTKEKKSHRLDENDEGEENSATDKEGEGEESEEEVGEKGVANNVEESGDASVMLMMVMEN
ncbi:hypothetical protein Bca101_046544 [Brassica carinata]